jgi:outer membrane protein
MKKWLSIVAISGLFFMIANANATNIAIVNIKEVVENSTAMKNADKKLTDAKNRMQKELQKEEAGLNAKRDDIASKSNILSKEALEKRMIDFQKDVTAFQNKVRQREDKLKSAYMDAVEEITDNIKTIIQSMKTSGKYDFNAVIASSTVVYSDNNLDITADVLKELNKKIRNVKMNL